MHIKLLKLTDFLFGFSCGHQKSLKLFDNLCSCKSVWETIAIYAIAAAAVPSMYFFIASLNVF